MRREPEPAADLGEGPAPLLEPPPAGRSPTGPSPTPRSPPTRSAPTASTGARPRPRQRSSCRIPANDASAARDGPAATSAAARGRRALAARVEPGQRVARAARRAGRRTAIAAGARGRASGAEELLGARPRLARLAAAARAGPRRARSRGRGAAAARRRRTRSCAARSTCWSSATARRRWSSTTRPTASAAPRPAERAARYATQRAIYALAVAEARGADEVEVAYVFLERPEEPVARAARRLRAGDRRRRRGARLGAGDRRGPARGWICSGPAAQSGVELLGQLVEAAAP